MVEQCPVRPCEEDSLLALAQFPRRFLGCRAPPRASLAVGPGPGEHIGPADEQRLEQRSFSCPPDDPSAYGSPDDESICGVDLSGAGAWPGGPSSGSTPWTGTESASGPRRARSRLFSSLSPAISSSAISSRTRSSAGSSHPTQSSTPNIIRTHGRRYTTTARLDSGRGSARAARGHLPCPRRQSDLTGPEGPLVSSAARVRRREPDATAFSRLRLPRS